MLNAWQGLSLSSRRAWIEIAGGAPGVRPIRRSPHGERGLKWIEPKVFQPDTRVALLTESVD